MIDIHTHIIYGVDDGPENLEISKAMIRYAVEQGTKGFVATSHFNPVSYSYSDETYEERLNILNQWIDDEGLDFKIYPGNELLLRDESIQDLREKKCRTLNGSSYLLIEFYDFMNPVTAVAMLDSIQSMGYNIVLAHVERIGWIKEKFSIMEDFFDKGYIFQVNGSSLVGKRHREEYKNALKLMSKGMVHLIGSDGHTMGRRKPELIKARTKIRKTLGQEAVDLLFDSNPRGLIEDREIVSLKEVGNYRLYKIKERFA